MKSKVLEEVHKKKSVSMSTRLCEIIVTKYTLVPMDGNVFVKTYY